MRLSKIHIKNFKSIKDSNDININDNLFVIAGQNESGKSSILEALKCFEDDDESIESLNFELENDNNFTQEISCTFNKIENSDVELLHRLLIDVVRDERLIVNEHYIPEESFEFEKLSGINEFTLTREITFVNSVRISSLLLDKKTLGILKGAVRKYDINQTEADGSIININNFYLDVDDDKDALLISETFFSCTPQFILFNDFTNLLPDKILIEHLNAPESEGYQAVINLQNLLNTKFESIASKELRKKKSTTDEETQALSANFQEDWQQRIFGNNKVNIKFDIERNQTGQQEIVFSVETKDNEYLAPRRRSKGMIWFLSLWLELKAREEDRNSILLFDEPGLHLHIKANKNMLGVFHKLVEKGHQIIYSTHSPSLIEVDDLHRIGLVVNDIKSGTTVEGLTTSKLNSSNRKEALQPISEAMGLEPLRDFSLFQQKNVLLEGLSDFWILKGFEKLMKKESNYSFIPAVGIKGVKIHPLISFCIGYGFDWLLVIDGGEHPKQQRELLKVNLFGNDETQTNSKILLTEVDEIENLFDVNDLALIDSKFKPNANKKPIEIIGKDNKIIFSKLFYSSVINGIIKKSQFSKSTLSNFESIFSWIEKRFDIKNKKNTP